MGIDTSENSGDPLQQTVPRSHRLVGSDSTSGLQLPQTISDGETHSITRVWTTGMLLHSQTCSQPGRTSTILCFERHRQGHSFLERKTCSSMSTFACSMDLVTYMVRKVLRQHCALMRPHTVTFQSPSSAVVFTKNPSVQDSLCNHKDYATRWADGETPVCICSTLTPYQTSPTSNSHHIHLDGDSLPTPSLSSIANGSLQNKIFPSKKEIWTNLQKAFVQWHQRNGIPAIPTRHLEDLWNTSWSQHRQQLHNHISHHDITQFTKLFPGAVFHNEDKRATSLRIYCPVLCLKNTFSDDNVSNA